MKNKNKREIIFKATVYRELTDVETGSKSREPLGVILYSDGSIVSKWCGTVVEKHALVFKTNTPEDIVIRRFKKYLADEIRNLEENLNGS